MILDQKIDAGEVIVLDGATACRSSAVVAGPPLSTSVGW